MPHGAGRVQMDRPAPTSWGSHDAESYGNSPPISPTSPRIANHASRYPARDERGPSRVAHTLTACGRCRNRKTKCDPGLPKCGPCDKSGATCEYWDQAKGRMISRNYVIRLQEKVRALEAELARFDGDDKSGPDPEAIVREAGLVHFDEGVEPRFLGSSSGIAMSRLVMELAKQTTGVKNIRELVSNDKLNGRKAASQQDSGEQKAYPMLSSVAASSLPTRPMTDGLAEVYCQRSQFLLPTLHEPTFRNDIEAVYNGSTDPYQNFILRMVLAISLQKLDPQYAGLADSYYLAAFAHVEAAMRPMDLKTLQCLVLIGQYSLLTPTRTAVYYVIGLATRLCQQLGLHEEETILQGGTLLELDPLEKDLRRRLFWIVTSMEYGLSHSLGRPSALSIGPDHIDVRFFEPIDDECITREGILPGPISPKKLIAIHFFQMRLLQAEIRRKLYQKKRDTPKNDDDPWFPAMEAKVEHWRSSSPYNAEGSGHSNAWFTSKYNTIIVLLFRPSPQIPNPSAQAAIKCFNASAYNVRMQRRQIHESSVDITWILVQSLFMALNTILWSISYPEVRKLNPKHELEELLDLGLESIRLCSDRWPGAASAYELYRELSKVRLRVYTDQPTSPSAVYSPSTEASPGSLLATMSQSCKSSPSTTSIFPQTSPSVHEPQTSPTMWDQHPTPALSAIGSSPSPHYINAFPDLSLQAADSAFKPFSPDLTDALAWDALHTSPPALPTVPLSNDTVAFAPDTFNTSPNGAFAQLMYPPQAMPFQPEYDGLSAAQQMELMDTLESKGMEHIGNLLDQSKNFFNSLGTP